ncbi:MAG: nucleotidyltransferase domain-containing protein [Polaromonas sp.]|nr:nucleotidyltransferase domain-containing protein [Polaromonas sp.]
MKPSGALKRHRTEIRRIVEFNHAANPRVFGSAARGEDTEASDLGILVGATIGETTLISLARIQIAIEELTGIKVDVRTPLDSRVCLRHEVLMAAETAYRRRKILLFFAFDCGEGGSGGGGCGTRKLRNLPDFDGIGVAADEGADEKALIKPRARSSDGDLISAGVSEGSPVSSKK